MSKNGVTRLAFFIVILCFLLSTFVSLWSIRLIGNRQTQEMSRMLAARIYDTISSDLSEPVHVARGMAHDTFLMDIISNEADYDKYSIEAIMRRYLSGLKSGLEYESAFVISEASKRYYTYNGVNKVIHPGENERDQWYQDFIESGLPYATDVDRDEVSQDAWTVFVDARMESEDGRLLGVCGVGVQMRNSQALFESLEQEYHVKINLIDSQGLIQVDTDEQSIDTPFRFNVPRDSSNEYVFTQQSTDQFVVSKYVEELGWTLVVQIKSQQVEGVFLNTILLNVVLCLIVLVILLLAMRIIARRTKALTDASFKDQTTKLLNRRAFEEEKGRLVVSGLPEDFVYVTADVNGLKTVNDTLGHAAGDELIVGAAQCLKDSFGEYGKIYRIGGDEFAAMLIIQKDKLDQVIIRFNEMTGKWRGLKVNHLSVSCGFAMAREHPSENISELGRISDEMMYAAKEAHYQSTGEKRRGK